MVRRDGAEARKERIKTMAQTIHSALNQNKENNEPQELPLKKTVAKLSIETGLTREKVMEYLALLDSDGHFILDEKNDKIKSISES